MSDDIKLLLSQLPATASVSANDRVIISVPIGGGRFVNKLITYADFTDAFGGGYEPGDDFYLQSPNGNYWQLTIDNDGNLSYEDIGLTLP